MHSETSSNSASDIAEISCTSFSWQPSSIDCNVKDAHNINENDIIIKVHPADHVVAPSNPAKDDIFDTTSGDDSFYPSKRTWEPYENQWTETPGLGQFCKVTPRQWYRWRWAAYYPLQWRVFGGSCTIGELLLILLAVGYVVGACVYTRDSPSGSGQVAALPVLYFTVTLAMRNSIWSFLLGLPFERALIWHAVSSYVALIVGIFHGLIAWYIEYDGWSMHPSKAYLKAHPEELAPYLTAHPEYAGSNITARRLSSGGYEMSYWHADKYEKYFITGWILTGAFALQIFISAFPYLRRVFFKLWLNLHIFLAVVIIGGTFIHGRKTIADSIAISILWFGEYLIRYVWMAWFMHAHEVEILALPGGVVKVTFDKKSFEYAGGQYAFLCIPGVSCLEWHPFSISSHPSQERVTMHIRCLGKWTNALYQLASKGEGKAVLTRGFIEGPYGSPSADIYGDRHDNFLLISGGIGITPMQSVMNDLISQHTRGRKIGYLWFVWSTRDTSMLDTVLDFDKEHAQHMIPPQQGVCLSSKAVNCVGAIKCSDSCQASSLEFSDDALKYESDRESGFRNSPYGHAPHRKTSISSSDDAIKETIPAITIKDTNMYPIEESICNKFKPIDLEQPCPDDQSTSRFLRPELYLTQKRDQTQFPDAVLLEPHQEQALRYGRPDLPKIFEEMAEIAARKNPKSPRVVVLTCGPMPMVKEVAKLCAHNGMVTSSGEFVRFEFHSEVFEF